MSENKPIYMKRNHLLLAAIVGLGLTILACQEENAADIFDQTQPLDVNVVADQQPDEYQTDLIPDDEPDPLLAGVNLDHPDMIVSIEEIQQIPGHFYFVDENDLVYAFADNQPTCGLAFDFQGAAFVEFADLAEFSGALYFENDTIDSYEGVLYKRAKRDPWELRPCWEVGGIGYGETDPVGESSEVPCTRKNGEQGVKSCTTFTKECTVGTLETVEISKTLCGRCKKAKGSKKPPKIETEFCF